MAHSYEFPRPGLTVDAVVFGVDLEQRDLQVLLVRRRLEPFAGTWALPGGYVHEGEGLEAAVRRELGEETGVTELYLEQLYTFGEPGRDPRGHVVTVAYYGLVKLLEQHLAAATDAADVGWFALDDTPSLAFDHAAILALAQERLRSKVRWRPVGFELLPERFTLGQLQRLYEILLEREVDKRNFRKKILSMDILLDTGEVEKDVAHRAARLYRFDPETYRRRESEGFDFEI